MAASESDLGSQDMMDGRISSNKVDQTVPYEDGAGAPPGEEDIFRLTKGVRCDCLSSGRLAY